MSRRASISSEVFFSSRVCAGRRSGGIYYHVSCKMTTGDALQGTLVLKVLLNVSKGIWSRRPTTQEHFFKALLCKTVCSFSKKKRERERFAKFARRALISALFPAHLAFPFWKGKRPKETVVDVTWWPVQLNVSKMKHMVASFSRQLGDQAASVTMCTHGEPVNWVSSTRIWAAQKRHSGGDCKTLFAFFPYW